MVWIIKNKMISVEAFAGPQGLQLFPCISSGQELFHSNIIDEKVDCRVDCLSYTNHYNSRRTRFPRTHVFVVLVFLK